MQIKCKVTPFGTLFSRFDLAHYLDGQPMQFMMRPRGDKARPYFAFEMWHEKLLAAAQRHHS
jgi:hypothetical protein